MLGFHEITPQNTDFEVLKVHFPQCFTREGAFDFSKFRSELDSSEINISKEGYSLDWLGKSYARFLASDSATTLLKEDEEHNSKPENINSQNLLIKGDNLEVLKHLSNAYCEKVKMIYIDPPYNTGSDGFVYNDDRKFTVEQLQELIGISEEKAQRILEFTQSRSNSHSAWLTFMYPRLYISRQLLKDDGVIFVSIDDNEVAQLRLLMDEVFGEENFVADFIRKTKSTTNDAKIGVNYQHEFLLCYAKNIQNIERFKGCIKDTSKYINPDNDPNGRWVITDPSAKSGNIQNGYFPVINPYTGKEDYPPKGRFWIFSKNTIQKHIDEGRICFKKEHNPEERGFIYKRYLKDIKTLDSTLDSLGFADNKYMNQNATKYLKEIGLVEYFSYPKSVEFIYDIINSCTQKDSLILDFFAGSGTTADAVMRLNASDGGNRRFILVQLPEPIDKRKNKVAYDFVREELGVLEPTIFEITKERILRAADRLNSELDNKLRSLQEELPMVENESEIAKLLALKSQNGFKIFETIPLWEDYNFRSDKLSNSGQLFDDDKLTSEDIKALFITWKTNDGIPLTEPVETVDLLGYQGYYVRDKLYLMDKGFNTDALKSMLEKIDLDTNFNPTSIIAFGYYFESKSLREMAENIKSYTNKKDIDIKFIIRY